LKLRLPSGLVSRRNPELVPAGATLALLLIAGFQMTLPSSVDLPDDTAFVPKRAVETRASSPRSYAAILAHPLFAPDRAPVIVEAQPSGNLSGFEVLGTAIAKDVSTALVRDATGRILRLKPDETLQGWRVVSIDRTQLVFDRDGERRALAVDMTRAKAGTNAGATRLGSGLGQAGAVSQSNDDDSDDNDSSDDSDD
jgi:hypothetical protein